MTIANLIKERKQAADKAEELESELVNFEEVDTTKYHLLCQQRDSMANYKNAVLQRILEERRQQAQAARNAAQGVPNG